MTGARHGSFAAQGHNTRFVHKLCDGPAGQHVLGDRRGFVELAVQGAQVCAVNPQGTTLHAPRRIDYLDNFKQRKRRRIAEQHEASIKPALPNEHAGTAESLEDFAEVASGDFGGLCDLVSGLRLAGGGGQANDGAQAIFSGMGDQK
jgi:hypothetical protein